jgi:tRNA G18 (ribose-2'-O)-methylase SpoU
VTAEAEWQRLAGEDRLVVLDGFHALKHAIRFEADIALAVSDRKDEVLALADELAPDITDALEARLVSVPTATFTAILPKADQTRVASLAVKPDTSGSWSRLRPEVRTAPVALLDNPRNLGNIGAVVRAAAGLGAAGVLTTGGLDPWHPNALRGSAGLHFATVVVSTTPENLPPGPVYAMDPEGCDLRDLTIPDDAVLAFGSERHGISDAIRARADHLVAIAMRPKVSSYNLATSVAMTLFHWTTTARRSRLTGP